MTTNYRLKILVKKPSWRSDEAVEMRVSTQLDAEKIFHLINQNAGKELYKISVHPEWAKALGELNMMFPSETVVWRVMSIEKVSMEVVEIPLPVVGV